MRTILITGGTGFLGRHIVTKLVERGLSRADIAVVGSHQCDMRGSHPYEEVMRGKDAVLHLAETTEDGLPIHEKPGEIFYNTITRDLQTIEAAYRARVAKFVALGTTNSYPRCAPIPLEERHLWHGYPEEARAPYGLAKRALLTQVQAYRDQYAWNAIYLLPAELYGPWARPDPADCHSVATLIKKIVNAKRSGHERIKIRGTGNQRREFLFVEDAAEAIILATERYNKCDPVNLGTGVEIPIAHVVDRIASLMRFRGEIEWDASRSDYHPSMLDTSRAEREFGFRARTSFERGLQKTLTWWEMTAATGNGPR